MTEIKTFCFDFTFRYCFITAPIWSLKCRYYLLFLIWLQYVSFYRGSVESKYFDMYSQLKHMVDTFGLTLEVISRQYKLEFSIQIKITNQDILLIFLSVIAL